MRTIIGVLILVSSIQSFTVIACEQYAGVAGSTALTKLEEKAKQVETLGAQLIGFQEKKVPESDPEHEKVAVALGTNLRKLYEMCVCIESLADNADCKEIRSEVEKTFDIKP